MKNKKYYNNNFLVQFRGFIWTLGLRVELPLKWREKKAGEKENKTLPLYMFGNGEERRKERRSNLCLIFPIKKKNCLTCKGKRKEKKRIAIIFFDILSPIWKETKMVRPGGNLTNNEISNFLLSIFTQSKQWNIKFSSPFFFPLFPLSYFYSRPNIV